MDKPFNVFSNNYRNEMDQVDEIANMINNSGANRAQRRKIEKSISRATKLSKKAMEKIQAQVENTAYEAYKEVTDQDYTYFNAILALVMYEDYHWTETENQEHGQIMSLLERVQNKIKKYQNLDYTIEDLVKEVDKKTGILLVSNMDDVDKYMKEEK